MTYTYKRTEPSLWTTGHYDHDGRWQPESDHGSPDEAAERIRWLNGGPEPDTAGLAERVRNLEDEVRALWARLNEMPGAI